MLALGFNIHRVETKATTLTVPDNYPTIQVAINAAVSGSTILVKNGTYTENVVINKMLSLLGENCATTTIDGRSIEDSVRISANNVTISGFTIKNSGQGYYDGIALNHVTNCNVHENIIKDNSFGILLSSSNNNSIVENNITANRHHGIGLWDSSDYNNVSRNSITSNHYAGIEVYYSDSNLIIGNVIAANGVGGIYVTESSRNTIKENNFTQPSGLGSLEVQHSSSYNMIFHNNFFANDRFQASVDSDCQGNSWDDGYPSGGNYWRNCSGKDENGDGICDSAYVIDGNNKDNYPLISPWTPSWVPRAVVDTAFWMQWWFWTITLTGTATLVGAMFFLRRKLPKTTLKYSNLGLALKQLKEKAKGIFSVRLRKTLKWVLYWSLIPALFNGLLACFLIALVGIPNIPVVFLLGFASYFIHPPTLLIWLMGVIVILAYNLLGHYGVQFPKIIKRRVSPKKLLVLWIMVPLLAYTIPYCVIMGQASLRATPYDPFRWDYAIFGYFIFLFLIAAVIIPYGVYVVIVLFTLWIMGIAKLYKDYQTEKKEIECGNRKPKK